MLVTNVTVWATLHGSAHKVEVEAEETVDETGMVALVVAERNALNAINLDISRVSVKRIRIFAIAAMALDILRKTVNRLVQLLLATANCLDRG